MRSLTITHSTFIITSDDESSWATDEISETDTYDNILPMDAVILIRHCYPSYHERRGNGTIRFYSEPRTIDWRAPREEEYCIDLNGFSALAAKVIVHHVMNG